MPQTEETDDTDIQAAVQAVSDAEPKAKKPTPAPSLIPTGITAPPGWYIFISRQEETTAFEFEGARPTPFDDKRLAWRFEPELGQRLMNHTQVTGQRILFAGNT